MCVDPRVYYLNHPLYPGLVSWLPAAGREDCNAVMITQIKKITIDISLILVCLVNARFKVIRNQGPGAASVIVYGTHNRVQKIFFLLTPYSPDIGLATVTKNRDKHLYIFELTICRVYNRQLLSCKINIHLVSGNLLYVK